MSKLKSSIDAAEILWVVSAVGTHATSLNGVGQGVTPTESCKEEKIERYFVSKGLIRTSLSRLHRL